jgi:hypothetical protein
MSQFTPVGFIISWQVPSIVQLDDLRNGIVAAGHDPLDLAPDLKPASLVARTAGLIAKQFSTKDVKRLARKVEHTERQITREDHDALGLTYSAEDRIGFDESTGHVVNQHGVGVIVEQTKIETTRRASDVTRVVQTIVEQAGSDLIPVRKQGGAYFVPAGHTVIDRARSVVEAVGGRLEQFACTIGHGDASDRTGQSVAQVITDYLLGQIDELQAAVDELNEAGIRSDVKSRRLTRVAELRDRLGAYASLLGAQASGLTTALDKAEATLLAKLAPEKYDVPASEPVTSDA